MSSHHASVFLAGGYELAERVEDWACQRVMNGRTSELVGNLMAQKDFVLLGGETFHRMGCCENTLADRHCHTDHCPGGIGLRRL
jgi:hypothetical protein